jgi:tRNA pseudouridine38-40 synthase
LWKSNPTDLNQDGIGMARYQLRLAYDGTDFFGFQRQGNTRTVQSVFESVLRQIGWQGETILFAGRTDTGVHAAGQVVVFDLDWHHADALLIKALNAKLPQDVAVEDLARAEAEFHPRYDASSRRYVYTIYQTPLRNPLQDRFAWHVWPELDLEKLDLAAAMLLGRHDFSAFGRAMKPGASTTREVMLSRWSKSNSSLTYEVEANAFLYHMVRRLVYVQVQVARQKISQDELRQGIETGTLLKPGLAPSRGLVLAGVTYPARKQDEIDSEILDDMA